jgi:hypothetical protein
MITEILTGKTLVVDMQLEASFVVVESGFVNIPFLHEEALSIISYLQIPDKAKLVINLRDLTLFYLFDNEFPIPALPIQGDLEAIVQVLVTKLEEKIRN